MSDSVLIAGKILAALTIVGQVWIFFALLFLFVVKKGAAKEAFIKFFKGRGVFFAFLVAFFSSAASMFYSGVAKFPPCDLCWYQRIALFPQTVLLGMAVIKHDKKITDYVLAFSIIGAVIAAYNYYIQLGGNPFIPCSAGGVSCAQRFVWEFGYVGIPMMSFTGFTIIICLMLIEKLSSEKK